MPIRSKVFLAILLVVFAVTSAGLFISLYFSKQQELLFSAFFLLIFGIAASFILSRFIEKPFKMQNERIKILIDSSPIAYSLWDKNFKVFECNDDSLRLLNLNSKQELMDRYFEFFPEYQPDGISSKEKAADLFNRAYKGEKIICEWTYQTRDGTLIPTEITLSRVPFKDDYAVVVYTYDLSEYINMIKEIEHRDKLIHTVNHAATILLQSDCENFADDLHRCIKMLVETTDASRVHIWKNITINGRAYCTRIYSWPGGFKQQPDELIKNVSYDDTLPGWEDTLSIGGCINKIICQMSPQERTQLSPQEISSLFVAPIFLQDHFWGYVSYENCHSERLFSDNEQMILRSGGIILANAILRNEIMQDLHASSTKLEAIISNYSGIIWNVDKNNTVTLLNGLYIKNLGLSPTSFEGWNLDAAVEKNKKLKTIFMNIHETFDEGPQDWIYFEDNDRTFHAHNTPIFDDHGEVISVMGVIDDITEITRLQIELEAALQEAQKANHAKSHFLASMSHEMRTPLNVVIGLSALNLENTGLDGETYSNLEKIYSAGSTLLRTVNDILDISKIEAGKVELINSDYDTPSLINDTITQNVVRIGEKPIKLILDLDESIPVRLYGDELRVKQIFNNLLSNAIKYTREGTIEFSIRCAREGNVIWLTVSVCDTGVGIKYENMDKLFFDYSQIDMYSNRNIEGTGLGLAITKRIVEMMDGEITVESEYGKGSIFTARFKQQSINDSVIDLETIAKLKNFHYSDNRRNRHTPRTRIQLPYAKVLVVDDNIANLDVAKGLMKKYGMRVDCVISGQQAVDAMRREEVIYNAVFMDHMMPGMDGIDAVRLIRETGSDYAENIPIIALTANAIAGMEQMFLSNGFQAFLAKPIDPCRLDEIIRRWVRDKSKKDEIIEIDESQGSGQLTGMEISGLDIAKGIERFSGDGQAYLAVLRSYALNTRPLLDSIATVHAESLPDYAITVHGIKSSSRGVCADSAGEMAEALEKAAKAGDFDFVSKNNVNLIATVRNLIADIENTLDRIDAENLKPTKDMPDRELLLKLLEACDKYNMDGAHEIMTEIDKYRYESDGELVDWLKTNILKGFLEEIREELSTLLTA